MLNRKKNHTEYAIIMLGDISFYTNENEAMRAAMTKRNEVQIAFETISYVTC